MNTIRKHPLERLGEGFVDPRFLPAGADEYHLRNVQAGAASYRGLTAREIEVLVRNENRADDWSSVEVSEQFDPELVRRCEFHGLVRIGSLEKVCLEFHDLRLPVGLYNSVIVSCDLGSNVVIDNVRYLSHYLIGNEVILLSIGEMLTTDHSKFGNGVLKEGEDEEVRIWLEIGNENGGRKILPFDGMLPSDAYLWSRYRGDAALLDAFRRMTEAVGDRRRGYYGTVGDRTIVKHCRILKDVKIGSDAYIKGANKLKNLTVNSSAEAGTQIGEGVELVNGIIGYGCRIFYGVKAVRFVMGSNATLKYGARLINSVLGDNSTISCCEVLNSLIFPGHEQHHNNSFLCAATLLGQTNVAAGATIGSNHNSRGSDGEILAGRGFWPGLCTSLKHSSRFASFTLLVKGSYPSELDIRLPFSLVSNNEQAGRLQILPAYWFLYNMYALARNSWKYVARDRRVPKLQLLEFSYLAPDTVEEIFEGMRLLELWTGIARFRVEGRSVDVDENALGAAGRELLTAKPDEARRLLVMGVHVEAGDRPVLVLKATEAHAEYRKMVEFYGVSTLVGYLVSTGIDREMLAEQLGGSRRCKWINLGGQLVPGREVELLRTKVKQGTISDWSALHGEYRRLADRYPRDRAAHALASVAEITGLTAPEVLGERWDELLDRAVAAMWEIARRTRESRAKDYENEFRSMMFETQAEMDAVVGTIEDDSFIRYLTDEAEQFERRVRALYSWSGTRVS